MCGIIGYVGRQNSVPFLINGLSRLEYRGYDSAGIGVFDASKQAFLIQKSEGKLENIKAQLAKKPLEGTTGIGHTRWATHGKPNTLNAHPHRAGSTILVHNGIIENYEEIRDELVEGGAKIVSETDTELFGHLVEKQMNLGLSFEEAVRTSFLRLRGSCSIVIANDKFPDRVIAIRNGTPLLVAHSRSAQGSFVASDAQAVLEHTNEVTFLENQDMVICWRDGFEVHALNQPLSLASRIDRKSTKLDWTLSSMDKAGFPHYMLKEIFEQPRAVLDTLDNLIDRESGEPRMEPFREMIRRANRIQIVACGTAWHASLLGKYAIERFARIPVEVDLASEYRYRKPIVDENTLFLAVSQSGETADTLAALVEAKGRGAMTAVICNARGSTIAREAGYALYTAAGPEIGVASTKAFTTQVLVLLMLAQYMSIGRGRGTTQSLDLKFYTSLPHKIQACLDLNEQILEVTKSCLKSSAGFLFLGRGPMFPIALEGALKMKEITYIHAEGYPAGELKHGPIAMVDSTMTSVVLAPKDDLYEKVVSNIQEVRARGGNILTIGSKGDKQLGALSHHFIGLDFAGDWSDPFLATIPLQLLAYHAAVLRGTDVDKPRNLAKSVTVE